MKKRLRFKQFKAKHPSIFFSLWNYNGIKLPEFQQFNSHGVPLESTALEKLIWS